MCCSWSVLQAQSFTGLWVIVFISVWPQSTSVFTEVEELKNQPYPLNLEHDDDLWFKHIYPVVRLADSAKDV